MDTFTAVLVGVVLVLSVLALALWTRNRRAARSIDDAVRRIGVDRPKRTARADALVLGIDRVETYISHAERDRAQLLAAMEGAGLGIMAIDDSGTVTFINTPAQQYVGVGHGDVITESRLREVLDEVVTTRRPARQELDLHSPGRRVLRLRAVPLDHGVESLGAVLYIEDITDQRRVDRLRKDFVASVGREVGSPLAAFPVLARTLSETDDPGVRSELARQLASEADRMAAVFDDLHELARVESFDEPYEPVPVSDLIAGAMNRVRPLCELDKVEIVIEADSKGASVVGDRAQLMSALVRLLDNACRFTGGGDGAEGGKVRIRTIAEPAVVRIEVRDNGIGIAEDHLDRIFERFYRVEQQPGSPSRGAGLGLSIVRHVVLNHGGEVGVESAPGHGSTFTLKLPMWKDDSRP